jgi:hypothetical protein
MTTILKNTLLKNTLIRAWIPEDDLTDVVLWLDGDDESTKTFSVSNQLSNWADKSGSGNDANEINFAFQPKSYSNVLNGKSVIRFDAIDDRMVTPLNLFSPYTVFVVFNYRSTVSAGRRAIQGSGNWLVGPHTNKVSHWAGGWVSHSVPVVQNQFYLTQAINTGATSKFYIDGVDETDDDSFITSPGTIGLSAQGLASAEPLGGDLAELIILDKAISAERANLFESYLERKWGL